MNLYLVQHGEAESEAVDPSRPLSARGRRDVQRLAALAARLGLEVRQIRHSGKTRAEQTAALFAAALSPHGGSVATSGLAPKDDVQPVAETLARETQPLMLVGHMPFMARLAGLLINGDPEHPPVRFHMGGIVCLTREEDRWLVSWAVTPEMGSRLDHAKA